MKYLFIHQNAPGQWRHIASELAKDPHNEVVIMGTNKRHVIAGARFILYNVLQPKQFSHHQCVIPFESAIYYAEANAKALIELRASGFIPDVICCHPGWGEGLFVKDIYPEVPYVAYTEFFYRFKGADVGFVPSQESLQVAANVRCKNARLLLALEQADYCVTPTQWQFSVHPQFIKDKTAIIHEGVRTTTCTPQNYVEITLQNGQKLKKGDEVVTFVSRNLEPYRGFPTFMRAIPEILSARPNAHILIIGGNGVSYGNLPEEGGNWKDKMLKELPIDLSRVHFLGNLPYTEFLAALQISSAHVYLTFPFVLSWSMLEAMSCECLVIGSSTKPVMEAIEHEHNGILVDFFNHNEVAHAVVHALANPQKYATMRKNARNTIIERYDMDRVCLPQWKQFIQDIVNGTAPSILKNSTKLEGPHLYSEPSYSAPILNHRIEKDYCPDIISASA